MRAVPFKNCECFKMYTKGFEDGEKFGKETYELERKFDEARIYRD
jgi:hypothetical protein